MNRILLCIVMVMMMIPAKAQAEKYALLVGIDAYPESMPPLDGCVKDVEMMQAVLRGKYGFPASNIAVLLNGDATFEGMKRAFQTHLIEQAQPGDAVVFYYSGHGSRTDDNNGDESDGFDETLCPVDISRDETTWLTDDVLNQWLSRLRTTQVTVILDSCFSGTATRGSGEFLSKFADLGFHGASKQAVSDNYHAPDAQHVLLAASSPEQESRQIPKTGSVFTMVLVDFLLNVAADVTYEVIMNAVAPAVSELIADVLPDSPQTPQAEGDLDRVAFAESEAAAAPPADPPPTPASPGVSESVQYSDFPLRISANATDYEEDDLMVVTVEAGRDCYLALYIIDAEQHVTQIFPNKWQQDNFIKAGDTVQIPPPGAAFRFRMTGPFGTETLKADASTAQFPDLDQTDWEAKPFQDFGTPPLADLNVRGVSVEENPDVERSQAVLRYEVKQRF